jgi:hypothetical protein
MKASHTVRLHRQSPAEGIVTHAPPKLKELVELAGDLAGVGIRGWTCLGTASSGCLCLETAERLPSQSRSWAVDSWSVKTSPTAR